MCRLLGFAAPRPETVQDVLGADQRAVFQDMARLHRDGWGSAWLSAGAGSPVVGERVVEGASRGRLGTRRSPLSGLGDVDLTRVLEHDAATARVMHLRMATDGMACTPGNTHPFAADDMAFAHNGSLTPTSAIDGFVSPEIAEGLHGDTDSERYFAAIRTEFAAGGDLLEAVVSTVAALREVFPRASMNALLLSPTELIAVHASDGALPPVHEFEASGLGDALPREHRDAYYLMRGKRLEDRTVVFASSGLDIADWTPLPAESVTSVDLATLEARTVAIADAPVRGR